MYATTPINHTRRAKNISACQSACQAGRPVVIQRFSSSRKSFQGQVERDRIQCGKRGLRLVARQLFRFRFASTRSLLSFLSSSTDIYTLFHTLTFWTIRHNIGLVTKWLRFLSLGDIDKTRNHLVVNPIFTRFVKRTRSRIGLTRKEDRNAWTALLERWSWRKIYAVLNLCQSKFLSKLLSRLKCMEREPITRS